MRRKKGYAGVSQKRKEAKESRPGSVLVSDYSSGGERNMDTEVNVESAPRVKRARGETTAKQVPYNEDYVRRMEEELRELRTKMDGFRKTGDRAARADPGPSMRRHGEGRNMNNLGVDDEDH